jgi:DcmR-like sensory protein
MDEQVASGHFHAVRFYDSEESLCRIVAAFIGEGLKAGQPALVIGTREHRVGIASALRVRGFDVDRLRKTGNLMMLDARDMLATFMIDDEPDAGLFHEQASLAIATLCRGRRDCTIRAYGEMVDLLWKDGQHVAAILVEMLWNKLAATADFSLLCGYATGNFYKEASVADICSQHTHAFGLHVDVSPETPKGIGRPAVH